MFYEFVWETQPAPSGYGITYQLLSRIWKKNWLNTEGTDRNSSSAFLGKIINSQDRAVVKRTIEYFWFYRTYHMAFDGVVQSDIIDNGDAWTVRIIQREITFYRTMTEPMSIRITEIPFQVQKSNGAIMKGDEKQLKYIHLGYPPKKI